MLAAGMGISASEFWSMTLSEFAILIDRQQSITPVYGKLTQADVDELKELIADDPA